MIIAGRNRGRVHATSATLQPTTIGGRQGTRALLPPPCTPPEPRSRAEIRNLLARVRPRAAPGTGERTREAHRFSPRAALLSFDTQAVVPLALLALALSAFIPGAHFELQTASDLSAVETAATLISALAAVLFFDRFWRHLRLRNLLLAGGLAVMAVSNLGAGLLLAGDLVIAGHSAAWIVLGGRLMGWVLIAGSVIMPDRLLRRPTAGEIRTIMLRFGAILVPVAAFVALNARTTSHGILHGAPLSNPTATLVAQILLAAITAVAAVAFRWEAGRHGSPPTRLLALACAFAAASALAACATPTFYASHVGISDVLRLGWLVALFACVCVEWSLDERHAPVHALAQERRRMAADVHDLIMQDLSFALANARTLAEDPARPESVSTVVSAGERALAGARDVVSALTEQSSRPIAEAVEISARTAARDTPLTFRVGRETVASQPDEPTRDALVHIAREAVTNAVKHARPRSIEVALDHRDEWQLTVRDDGHGFSRTGHGGEGSFDRIGHGSEGGSGTAHGGRARGGFHAPDRGGVGGFGLGSMRRQVEALGGTLRVGTAEQGGTTVEASLP
jgi:signal transduction histidine kinase